MLGLKPIKTLPIREKNCSESKRGHPLEENSDFLQRRILLMGKFRRQSDQNLAAKRNIPPGRTGFDMEIYW